MQLALRRNVGRLDQILRLGIGALLVYLGFVDTSLVGDGLLAVVLGAFGILDIVAALLRWCPLYNLAGIDTSEQ